jgi:hypothetical protein
VWHRNDGEVFDLRSVWPITPAHASPAGEVSADATRTCSSDRVNDGEPSTGRFGCHLAHLPFDVRLQRAAKCTEDPEAFKIYT